MHISYKLICPTHHTHDTAQNILMNAEGPRTCCTSCESFLRSSCIDDVLMNSILAPIFLFLHLFSLCIQISVMALYFFSSGFWPYILWRAVGESPYFFGREAMDLSEKHLLPIGIEATTSLFWYKTGNWLSTGQISQRHPCVNCRRGVDLASRFSSCLVFFYEPLHLNLFFCIIRLLWLRNRERRLYPFPVSGLFLLWFFCLVHY